MLSKVAERLYWTARYIERVENTARLVSVYDKLLFDLPKDINIGWYNLVVLNSATELFEDRYKVQDERNVVKFMLADDTNPSSMLSALKMVRENIRTSRDVVPAETWELINEVYLYAKNNIQLGINRSRRHDYLSEVIKGCQMLSGLLYGTMSHDAGWQFMKIGRDLERADMTTRILDAGAFGLLQANGDTSVNLRQIVWGNVLRSASAYMSYRRTMKGAVYGPDVANFMLEDPHFPRAFQFCLMQMDVAAAKLPKNDAVRKVIKAIKPEPRLAEEDTDLGQPFRDYLNDLQVQLGELHEAVAETWFPVP
ncbi:alpha-E domain-containing protein [Marinobacterium mangrovicola]|uniref:Putative alpha-E superfamily protein n=1 Tax=Marinobacterium mangrovicola TaxID=1476959 RepID=A0A4V2PD83_9GAMM|nr:alpha-E domain-containing protein [Marinobacterium mangrovicola]TCK04166.1 putative alpha-E superfamily protein [Marinobacterium mangrovicola]